MTYPYTVKVDKNKVTVGMARRLQGGSIDALVDVVAALSVDEHGVKPDHALAAAAIDEMSMEEWTAILDLITETFTPKAS